MKKNNLWIILGILIIAIILINILVFIPKSNTIKIGAILPLTGNVAYWGQPVGKGMEFAVNEINENGGIDGRKIKLIIEDSKGDPTEAVSALNKLLTIDDIITVSAHTTAVSNAVAPVLEENKIPWIANAADTGLPLTYDYAFKTFYNAYDECKKLVNHGSQEGMSKYGLLLPNMPWGEWCSKGVKEIVGEENTIDLRYTFGETDFKTPLLKAKNEGVDGLFWIGFPFESNAINKQKTELEIKIPLLCGYGHECVSDSSLSEIPKEYLEGYIIFDFVITTDFKEKYAELSSAEIIPAAFGYDEIYIIANALEKCENINKECLYDNLSSVKDYPTALNSNGFDDMKNLEINTVFYKLKDKDFVRI